MKSSEYKIHVFKGSPGLWWVMVSHYDNILTWKVQKSWPEAVELGYEIIEQHQWDALAFA